MMCVTLRDAGRRLGVRLWRVLNGLTILLVVMTLGAAVETHVFPAYTRPIFESIAREGDDLCWRWRFDKRRGAQISDWGLHLRDADGNDMSFTPVSGWDKRPMNLRKPLAPKRAILGYLCAPGPLPDWANGARVLTLSGAFYTPSITGLWRVERSVPTVAIPAARRDR